MKIEMSEIRDVCCNHDFIDSLMEKNEDEQKREFLKLVSVHEYLKSARFHFQSKLFEEIILPIKDNGGTKEDFGSYLTKAEDLLSEIVDFMEGEIDVEDIPEDNFSNFEAGEDGDLYGLWEEQYNWDSQNPSPSLIHQADNYLERYQQELSFIRDGILYESREPSQAFFFSHSAFAHTRFCKDYGVLCHLLKQYFLAEYERIRQDLLSQM